VIFKNKIKGYSKIKWQFSDGTILHSPDARHTFTSAGKYWVKLIVLAANRTEQVYVDTVRVFQNPKSDFEVYEVGAGAFSSIYFYNHSLNGVRFEWYQGDSLFSSEKEPVQYSRDLSKYSIKLKIWSENNCSDSVVITNPIDQGKDYYILFPNVFMPSRSGANAINSSKGVENSTFFSKTNGVDKYNIQIFNKWGVKLFESSNPDAIWDGYYKSVILPQDVYIWKVWGRYNSGKVFEKRGSVLLLNGGD
jgi:PKD repeat protein